MSPTDLSDRPAAPPPDRSRDAVPDDVRVAAVLSVLVDRGFRASVTGRHAVAEREQLRVVLPLCPGPLPALVLRRLDWSLAPVLGRGRLLAEVRSAPRSTAGALPHLVDDGPTPTAAAPSLRLSVVVEQPVPNGPWCAFVVEEPTIMGVGATEGDAAADAALAAAAWLGAPAGSVAVDAVRR